MAVMMIDPPSGWMYGFPIRYDEEVDGNIVDFLVAHGYPREVIDEFEDGVPVRMWEAN